MSESDLQPRTERRSIGAHWFGMMGTKFRSNDALHVSPQDTARELRLQIALFAQNDAEVQDQHQWDRKQ